MRETASASRRAPRRGRAPLPALVLVVLTGAGAGGDDGRWVGTWAAAPQLTEPANLPPEPGLADATLRQVVYVSLGGRRPRVLFDAVIDLDVARGSMRRGHRRARPWGSRRG